MGGRSEDGSESPGFPAANPDLFGANNHFAMPYAWGAIQLPGTDVEKGDSL
jgi:hypothetical protein